MTSYKELMMSRDAFLELRQKIRNELAAHPETSGGEILDLENDPDTGDLLVTAQYADGQRTHRVIIKDEAADVPRETSPPTNAHDALLRLMGKEPEPSQEEWEARMRDIERRAIAAGAIDVPRETSPGSPHQRMLDFLAQSDRIIAERGLDAHSKMSPEEWDAHMQEIARRAVTEDVDVPRETSAGD